MKIFCACLLIFTSLLAHSQTDPKPAEAAQPQPSVKDFGLNYPLSNEWVRATKMSRKTNSLPNFDLLLAAVYVPKSNLSATSPFFSLLAYQQPANDCKRSLEVMSDHSREKGKKDKSDGTIVAFSAAGRDYFRVDMARGAGGRHRCIICTVAKGHLLFWNVGAPNEKGIDAVVATLDSITTSPSGDGMASGAASGPKDGEGMASSTPAVAPPEKVRISSGVSSGLLVKKVNPIYPEDARAAYIQGTVLMKAEISKTGDITDLELLDGPIELAGSAVAAVRQWKYKPFLLKGNPVIVMTQIQVNYQLQVR